MGNGDLTDMAMQKPHSWIIRLERNGQVTPERQERHIPSWRIVELEMLRALIDVVGRCVLSEDHKIVAVQVDGMVGWGVDLGGEAGHFRSGDDEVDVALGVVFGDHGVFGVESFVFEIEDCGV